MKVDQTAIHGTPDFLICLDRWFIALELKSSLEEVQKARNNRTLQCYTLDLIGKAGGLALMVSPEKWDETADLLRKMSKRQL